MHFGVRLRVAAKFADHHSHVGLSSCAGLKVLAEEGEVKAAMLCHAVGVGVSGIGRADCINVIRLAHYEHIHFSIGRERHRQPVSPPNGHSPIVASLLVPAVGQAVSASLVAGKEGVETVYHRLVDDADLLGFVGSELFPGDVSPRFEARSHVGGKEHFEARQMAMGFRAELHVDDVRFSKHEAGSELDRAADGRLPEQRDSVLIGGDDGLLGSHLAQMTSLDQHAIEVHHAGLDHAIEVRAEQGARRFVHDIAKVVTLPMENVHAAAQDS